MSVDEHRRCFLIAVPAIFALSACIRPSKVLEGRWGQFAVDAADRTVDHRQWDAFLARHLQPGADGINHVAYSEAAQAQQDVLRPYLASLESVDPATLAKDEQMAFWINLYNAATVDLILQKPRVKSIRDLGLLTTGPWDKKIIMINGIPLSLNDVEHGILRPIWKDVRIHYAVNCASIGCPNLAARAYTAANLEAMLEEAARTYINHPRGFDRVDGALVASNIFDWYTDDWGNQAAVLDHARKYASGKTKAVLGSSTEIDSYDYDWSLNDVG